MEKFRRAGQATDDNMAHAHCMLDTQSCKYTHSDSFYFFTNLIHLVFFTIFAYLSLHVSDQSVHHQDDQMFNYTSSFWRRSLGR